MVKTTTHYLDRETGSVSEAADYLGIGKNQAYEAVHRGEIPAAQFGGRWIVSMVALRRKVESGGQLLPIGADGAPEKSAEADANTSVNNLTPKPKVLSEPTTPKPEPEALAESGPEPEKAN